MISFLRGILVAKDAHHVVIDVGGVGYRVFTAITTAEALGSFGNEVVVYTYMQVSEASMTLYGFRDEQERLVFEKLISVSGVGPKVAISALSAYSAHDLMGIIAAQDANQMSKVPGVGKKTAQRILIDLKDAFAGFGPLVSGFESGEALELPMQSSDAIDALLGMGFTLEEIQLALKGYTGLDDTQEMIRFALKRLGGF